jgi:hypothetical protein
MAVLMLIAAATLQTLPAPGAIHWEAVAEDGTGHYAIDPGSIARDGDSVRFLLHAVSPRAESDGANSAVVRYVVDCRRRTVAAESADFYRPDGRFAYSRQRGGGWGEAEALGPQRSQSAVFRRICPGG